MVAAEMKLMAIGMKIRDLKIFSRAGPTWLVSVANMRPIPTVSAGTKRIHKKLLSRIPKNSAEEKSSM